jgi:hypothetical protein
MAIFVAMLQALQTFLNRPLAEDFSVNSHVRLSLPAGVYVFIFVCLLNGSFSQIDEMAVMALLSVGIVVTVLFANVVIPKVLPALYDEERWTVGRHVLHTLFVLFLISGSNQAILSGLNAGRPSLGQMYLYVTLIGFFPVMLGVFVAEQRRLKRNLAQAQTLNQQLGQRAGLTAAPAGAQSLEPELSTRVITSTPKPILLASDNGKERLSLQPDQLLYVESVGNYVEVHWLNLGEPPHRTTQKTILRSTLKDVADALAVYPQFFRCHRAYLVNINAVCRTEGNARGYQLRVTDSAASVPVSRSYLEAFDARFSARQ